VFGGVSSRASKVVSIMEDNDQTLARNEPSWRRHVTSRLEALLVTDTARWACGALLAPGLVLTDLTGLEPASVEFAVRTRLDAVGAYVSARWIEPIVPGKSASCGISESVMHRCRSGPARAAAAFIQTAVLAC
jgi:hypothetical protein